MAYISFQPKDYFNTKLYTGNSTDNNAQTGIGFSPSWVWIKGRSNAGYNHNIYDAVRGATKYLRPNSTGAEVTDALTLKSFDSDGFTLGTDATNNEVNDSGINYVAWNWRASNTTAVSNTDGSITSTVSASTTSGFSIVKYTGTGANATVGHSLGVAPKMIIVKNLDSGLGYKWVIGHSDLASGGTGFSANWYFDGFATGARNQNATASWNSTSPTNSVFSLHSGATYMNASGEANIAYCFAEKKGFSKFGSYIGNGSSSDAPFIYTGFKPAMVMVKCSSASSTDWIITDNKRGTFNPAGERLYPNLSAAEDASGDYFNYLSNGFKFNGNVSLWNTSGATYIYMAFAEHPLVSSNGVPAVAR